MLTEGGGRRGGDTWAATSWGGEPLPPCPSDIHLGIWDGLATISFPAARAAARVALAGGVVVPGSSTARTSALLPLFVLSGSACSVSISPRAPGPRRPSRTSCMLATRRHEACIVICKFVKVGHSVGGCCLLLAVPSTIGPRAFCRCGTAVSIIRYDDTKGGITSSKFVHILYYSIT